jgi:paxillin
LVCSSCNKPIERYNVKDDKFLCQDCFRVAVPPKRCAKCQQEIVGASVVALGSQFHADCFTCAYSGCGKVIRDDYVEHDGKAYCTEASGPCYKRALGKVCAACSNPLETNYLSVLGKQFHRQCFACKMCSKPFETLEFFPINDEPYCEPCAMKLQMAADQPH